MNNNLTTFTGSLLVNHFIPNGSEEANHRTIDVLPTEELLHLCDKGGGLPVTHFLPSLHRHDFVLRHVVEQTFPAATLCCDGYTAMQTNKSLGNVHRSALPHSGVSH